MNKRAILRIGVAVIAGILIGAIFFGRSVAPIAKYEARISPAASSTIASAQTDPENSGRTYSVVKVVDGDTIDVSLNGKTVRLRLIGLDTPETVDPRKPVQCFGREASDEAKRLLTGQSVRIEYDPSQGTLDKYGRTLAYVFLPDGTLFDEYMIANGYGHEYTYDLPYKYQKEFKAAEAEARAQEKGLWAPDTCAGDTEKPAATLHT